MSAWSQAALQTLTSGWLGGRGSAELAADLGVTPSAVRSKRHHLGLPARSEVAVFVANSHNGATQATGLRPLRLATGGGQGPKGAARIEAWAPLPGSQPTAYDERAAGMCCWPVDPPGQPGGPLACSEPQVEGSVYCAEHLELSRSHQPLSRLRV